MNEEAPCEAAGRGVDYGELGQAHALSEGGDCPLALTSVIMRDSGPGCPELLTLQERLQI